MKRRIILLIALWTAFCAWVLWGWLTVHAMPPMAYELMERADAYEVRRYEPYVIAQVPIQGPGDPSVGAAAALLDAYAKGDNLTLASLAGGGEPAGESLAAHPASMVYEQRSSWFAAAILPAWLRITTVPRPNDPNIRLAEVPEQTVAVMTVRGRMSAAHLQSQRDAFLALLEQDGRTALSSARVVRWYGDATPPFLRRTELHVTLRNSGR